MGGQILNQVKQFVAHDQWILNLLVLLVWRLCFIFGVTVLVLKKCNNRLAGQHACKKAKMSLYTP
jgi:hypothetical protein